MEQSTKAAVINAAGNAASGILGMFGQRKREKRAMANQQQLMQDQQRNQMQLNQQGHDLQMQMWKETNYPAQMEMLKEAGLNPSLMYNNAGGSATTAGNQGGGSAAAGNAPAPQQMPMTLANMTESLVAAANIELMKANAKKAEAEADSIRGEEGTIGQAQIGEIGTRIEKLKAETQHEAVKQTLTQAEKYLKDVQYDKTMEEAVIASIDRAIKSETWEDQIKGIKAEVARTLADIELKEKGIELNEAQRKAVEEGIIQKWWEIGVKGVGTIVNGVIGKGAIDAMGKKGSNGSSGQWRKNE